MQTLESEAQHDYRHFPCVFTKATGSRMIAEDGREYVDFLAGAGVLNYGHDNPLLKYSITQSLDLATDARRGFVETFKRVILQPRELWYTLQFPGPHDSDAVAAATALARKVTGRRGVIAFTNGTHVDPDDTTIMPFDGRLGWDVDTLDVLERYLAGAHSGVEPPAALIVETVQGEGGVNVAGFNWLRRLERIARKHGALLILDDVQAGCGRCGSFFSFEGYGITPDLVCLSKALSGFGLPMALTLIRPGIDRWSPGEHDGTFRGHNLAFVTATAALDHYWRSHDLADQVHVKGGIVADRLHEIALLRPGLGAEVRGRGLMWGLDLGVDGLASDVARAAFERGLVIETSGPGDRVLKILPPLTISLDDLMFGLDVIEAAVDSVAPAAAGVWQLAA